MLLDVLLLRRSPDSGPGEVKWAFALKEEKCPVCREILSEDFRDELKPKDERERKRLVNLMRTLDGLSSKVHALETSPRRRKRLERERMAELGDDSSASLTKPIATVVIFLVWILVVIAAFSNWSNW